MLVTKETECERKLLYKEIKSDLHKKKEIVVQVKKSLKLK